MYKLGLTAFLMFLLSFSAFGLVDYSSSGNSSFSKRNSNLKTTSRAKGSRKNTITTKRTSSRQNRQSSSAGEMFSLTSGYDKIKYKFNEADGDASLYKLNGTFRTNYDVFLDFKYWGAISHTGDYSKNLTGSESGNLTTKLGFNWIKIGAIEERSTIDLFAGFMMAKKDSIFGSSRNDKIIGIETSKRFYNLAIGFGYELILTGTPKGSEEVNIGNIQKISAGIAVVISPDISFLVEGATIKINRGSDDAILKLEEAVSYAYISPKMILGISNLVSWELGAVFRTKKDSGVSDEVLFGSKLWDIDSTYGNSIFTGLTVSI